MSSSANKLLGYPDEARLLIVSADDFGMCHAVNEAILGAFKEGVVTSTSLMVPCPWALHAVRLLKENPDVPFAVHLTLIAEAPHYRWGAVSSKERVPSLLAETGYFYGLGGKDKLLEVAALNEVEREFRAQIEVVLAAGLSPTHLDWHCLQNGGRDDIFELTLRLAGEYGLALRVHHPFNSRRFQAMNLPFNDHALLDSFALELENKAERYIRLLKELPTGLSEWAVHPGFGTAELRGVSPGGWRVRQTDYDFCTSAAALQTIREEGIVLLDYRAVQKVWTSSPERNL